MCFNGVGHDRQSAQRDIDKMCTWQLSMYPSKAVRVVVVGGAGAGALGVPVPGTEGVPGDPGVVDPGDPEVFDAGDPGVPGGDADAGPRVEPGVGITGEGAGVRGAGFPKISCREDESHAHIHRLK